jgi:hypothetical protein
MKLGFRVGPAALAGVAVVLAGVASARAQAPAVSGTPTEMVATYSTLADGILALKRTEGNLVRSILAATLAHGQVAHDRAQMALATGDVKGAAAAIEALASDVGQLATEGDNAVGAVRKRLLEGGHHHNAAGEAQGIYDEGYVVVTRAAKAKLLVSARAIAGMAVGPRADALSSEWKKVEEVVAGLLQPAK